MADESPKSVANGVLGHLPPWPRPALNNSVIGMEQAYRQRKNLPLLTDEDIAALKAGEQMPWERGETSAPAASPAPAAPPASAAPPAQATATPPAPAAASASAEISPEVAARKKMEPLHGGRRAGTPQPQRITRAERCRSHCATWRTSDSRRRSGPGSSSFRRETGSSGCGPTRGCASDSGICECARHRSKHIRRHARGRNFKSCCRRRRGLGWTR